MKNRIVIIFSVIIGGTILFSACASVTSPIESLPVLESQVEAGNAEDPLFAVPTGKLEYSSLYEAVNQGVASITVYSENTIIGQGSGFLFDFEGHILTNYHVIEGASEIEVAFANGSRERAVLIGADLDSDVAVIKTSFPIDDVTPLPLGSSDSVRVGEYVAAIGNPYGLSGTMTVGIISARGRLLDSLRAAPSGGFFTAPDLIQTDAAINPGNSGGPLLNLAGEVIGINRAIRTNEGGNGMISNTGIGFAVPIDIVKRVVPYLIRDGKYDYPYLGIVSRETLTLFDKEQLGLDREMTGAYVIDVSPDGPAEKAGIQGANTDDLIVDLPIGGDLIIAMNGETVRSFSDLLAYLVTNTSPGDIVEVTVLRGDEELVLPVELTKRPE
jgi:S1-C subfamily serine protease